MKRTYTISEPVRGERRTPAGAGTFEFDAGTVTPKDAAEAEVLDYLVSIGLAEVDVATKPTKRTTKEA